MYDTTGANCINCDAEWCYFKGKLGNPCTGYIKKLSYITSNETIKIKKEEKEFYCPHCGKKFKTEI